MYMTVKSTHINIFSVITAIYCEVDVPHSNMGYDLKHCNTIKNTQSTSVMFLTTLHGIRSLGLNGRDGSSYSPHRLHSRNQQKTSKHFI